ncbi:MAG: DUF2855 family protein [Caulobacterales bacterium]|nr:DUF2855 family protein [Caulobacterales bacterium]
MDVIVNKGDLRDVRAEESAPLPALADGEVDLAVDQFALTANNITYAAFGEAMRYWEFFPRAEGWGCVPVWGFADVVASRAAGVAEGARVYGYFPMSTGLRVRAARAGESGFIDAAPHRAELASVYNSYRFTAGDPHYAREREALQMLLQPLFITGFLIADFLDEADRFGAASVVISSASSKTAIGLAHALGRLARRPSVVALTSSRNAAFVTGLSLYDEVRLYDDLTAIAPAGGAVYVDFAGDGALRRRVHEHFGADLAFSSVIGASHWEAQAASPPEAPPGPKPEFFFAPSQIDKRIKDWGPEGFQRRYGAAWAAFRDHAAGWLKVTRGAGPEAVIAAYREVLEGRAPADVGHALTLRAE